MNYKVEWNGPYSIVDSPESKPLLIGRDDPTSSGLYLFSVLKDNSYYPIYVGKAVKISTRLKQHIEGMLGGTTWVYDVAKTLRQGKLEYTDYRSSANTINRAFINDFEKFSNEAYQCLKMLHVFIATLEVNNEELELIESAVIDGVKKCEQTKEIVENAKVSRRPDPTNTVVIEASASLGIDLKGVVGSLKY